LEVLQLPVERGLETMSGAIWTCLTDDPELVWGAESAFQFCFVMSDDGAMREAEIEIDLESGETYIVAIDGGLILSDAEIDRAADAGVALLRQSLLAFQRFPGGPISA